MSGWDDRDSIEIANGRTSPLKALLYEMDVLLDDNAREWIPIYCSVTERRSAAYRAIADLVIAHHGAETCARVALDLLGVALPSGVQDGSPPTTDVLTALGIAADTVDPTGITDRPALLVQFRLALEDDRERHWDGIAFEPPPESLLLSAASTGQARLAHEAARSLQRTNPTLWRDIKGEILEVDGLLPSASKVPRNLRLWAEASWRSKSALGTAPRRVLDGPVHPTSDSTQETTTSSSMNDYPSKVPPSTERNQNSQQRGDHLERAFLRILTSLFTFDKPSEDHLLKRLRRQRAGSQYGRDIDFDCLVNGTDLRCHVECKYYSKPISSDPVTTKLAQAQMASSSTPIDHWILLSPTADPSNDLANMLRFWADNGTYPFSVHVWSPEANVDQLFALEPDVFQEIYGHEPIGGIDRDQIRRQWLSRLGHESKLPTAVRRYRADAELLCADDESLHDLDTLWTEHVDVRAADETGVLLQGTLHTNVRGMLSEPTTKSALLLGDFGDGKSVFTYLFARSLHGEPTSHPGELPWVVLRILLRDFPEGCDPNDLISHTLLRIGVTWPDWIKSAAHSKRLVILDGIDEMSSALDDRTLTENVRRLRRLVAALGDVQLLATSRDQCVESPRVRRRLHEALGEPEVFRLTSVPRTETIAFLGRKAEQMGEGEKFSRLRGLYDPVGLASKPLFLQMITASLGTLPDHDFSVGALYSTYVRAALDRKIELLKDRDLWVLDNELMANLLALLADVALGVHASGGRPFDLKRVGNSDAGIASLLWQMSSEPWSVDNHDDADAVRRVGTRSLLKVVRPSESTGWLVDFFHRSMREYFVAMRLHLDLEQDTVPDLLRTAPLSPPIAFFFGELESDESVESVVPLLVSIAQSQRVDEVSDFLGGNALSLIYASRRIVPGREWRRLRLDGVRLAGADLSGMCFNESSLQSAVLDNVILRDADVSGANLTGARFSDSVSVRTALWESDSEDLLLWYEDGTARRWRSEADGVWVGIEVDFGGEIRPRSVYSAPGCLILVAEAYCAISEVGETFHSRGEFRTRDDLGWVGASAGGWAGVVLRDEGEVLYVAPKDLSPFTVDIPGGAVADCGDEWIAVVGGDGAMVAVSWAGHVLAESIDVSGRVSAVACGANDEQGGWIVVGTDMGEVVHVGAGRDSMAIVGRVRVGESAISVLETMPGRRTFVGLSDGGAVVTDLGGAPEGDLHLGMEVDGLRFAGVRGPREKAIIKRLVTAAETA